MVGASIQHSQDCDVFEFSPRISLSEVGASIQHSQDCDF